MKKFLLSITVVIFIATGSTPGFSDVLGGGKRKGHSNAKIIKRNNKKRHKAGKALKVNTSSSHGKHKSYPFS
jgi:hypothetical protein